MPRLSGKVVAVTGGSRGLGVSIAAACAAEGAQVAVLARNREQASSVAAGIGESAAAFAVDVTDPRSVDAALAAIGERFGRLDVLVNNAAVGTPHTLAELTDDDLARELSTNVGGPILCARAALPLLRASGEGDVVNISTAAVASPYPTMWLYSATKAALEVASAGLADELRADGIRVSVLRVGSIADTSFQDDWPDDRTQRAATIAAAAGRERFAGSGRMSPDLVARFVVDIVALPREARVDVLEIRPA